MTTQTQTTEIPAYVNVDAIKAEFAPYTRFAAFDVGYNDYMTGKTQARKWNGVDGQAYDRGMNAAMKVRRAADWINQNVGAN